MTRANKCVTILANSVPALSRLCSNTGGFSFGDAMRVPCPRCGATLGEYALGNMVIRHRQRLIVVAVNGVQALQCWRCGAILDGDRVRAVAERIGGEHAPQDRPAS